MKDFLLTKISCIDYLLILLNYLISDLKKKQRTFKIGLASVCLVVSFLVLLQSAISISGLMFIKLSESNVGEADIIISPNSRKTFVNSPTVVELNDVAFLMLMIIYL